MKQTIENISISIHSNVLTIKLHVMSGVVFRITSYIPSYLRKFNFHITFVCFLRDKFYCNILFYCAKGLLSKQKCVILMYTRTSFEHIVSNLQYYESIDYIL